LAELAPGFVEAAMKAFRREDRVCSRILRIFELLAALFDCLGIAACQAVAWATLSRIFARVSLAC
jgi:hypothetical protein